MSILLIAVAAIALFTAFVLPVSPKALRGDNILRLYFLSAALLYLLIYADAVRGTDIFSLLLVLVNQITAPLIFFFSERLMFDRRISLKSGLPVLLPLIYSALTLFAFLIVYSEDQLDILFSQWPFTLNPALLIVNFLELFIIPAVILYLIIKHRIFRRNLMACHSSLEDIELRWLRIFYYVELFSWFLATLLFFLFRESLFYGLGFAGAAVVYLAYARLSLDSHMTPEPEVNDVDNSAKSSGKGSYEKSGASEKELELFLKQLNELMESDKIFRENRLTLRDLSSASGITEHNISRTLNQHGNQSFFQYVNRFRVEEVLRRMEKGDAAEQTILSIALESGFNSKSTFNRVFREITGMTPSEAGKKVPASGTGR